MVQGYTPNYLQDLIEHAGGAVPQPLDAFPPPVPESVKTHQKKATASGYKEAAVTDGIAWREAGLFPPDDPLLRDLCNTPGLRPFEKHLAGEEGPYQRLPLGGWTTGDAAARAGLDLRLFYREPGPGALAYGTMRGALRYGDGACIGNGLFTSVHGGAIESALDEATAELTKIAWKPVVSTVEISFKLRKAVPPHTSLLVECKVKEQHGIRLVVEGSIRSADGATVLASCEATLADLTQFI